VLLLLILNMLAVPSKLDHHKKTSSRDLMKKALYPLALSCMLNSTRVSALAIASSEIYSIVCLFILVRLVLLVAPLEWMVF